MENPKQSQKLALDSKARSEIDSSSINSQQRNDIGVLNALIPPKPKPQFRSELDDRKSVQVKNIFSKILDDAISEEQRLRNPQLIRVKNNILLILLLLSAYGIYFLIGDFIDILLTAFIAGIAYQQTRRRFANFIMKKQSYEGTDEKISIRLIKCLFWVILILILPKVRYMLAYPERVDRLPTYLQIFESLSKNKNFVVFGCQFCMGMNIIYLLLGKHLKKIGRAISPKNRNCVNFAFLIITLIISIIALIFIPSVLFREISSVGYLAQQKIEEKLGCQIISIVGNDNENNNTLPYCSEIITSENQFIKQTIKEFKDQNETIEKCIEFVKKFQHDYVGRQIFDYDELACTWATFIQKAYNYTGIAGSNEPSAGDLVMTGTNIFKMFFGNLTFLFSQISNFIFSATTFLTMFILTTQTFSTSNALKEIMTEQKQQLVSSITNLIQATFLIVFEHFIVSVVLLEIFDVTNINLLFATMLSSMAFFPFFRPWFGVLIAALIKILISGNKFIPIIFVILYYYISEKIYSFHYRKMEIHEIVTNMSVLFGIYRFGIAGIFYGPLIIIVYKCVEKELIY